MVLPDQVLLTVYPHLCLSLSLPLSVCFCFLSLSLSLSLPLCLFKPHSLPISPCPSVRPQPWTLALPDQLCKVLNSTLITCPSPGALSNASAPVDFFINGRAYADEVAVAEELLDPEEAQRGSPFRLDYLPDPQFSTAKREKWIKHHPGEPLTLVIHVSASGCWAGGPAWAQPETSASSALCSHRRSRTAWGSRGTSTGSR